VVQAVSSNGTDQAFGVRILPRTLRRREYFLDLQGRDSQTNIVAVHAIPIAEQIPRRCVVAEGLDDLLGRPGCCRMVRHVEVKHLATPVFQDDEQVQNLHGDGGHGEEVNRNHLAEVIVQERLPGLAGRPRQLPENTGNRAFGDLDAEHLQLTVNPRCPPKRIGRCHPFYQAANLDCRSGPAPTALVHLGQPCPEPAKPLALPADDRVSLDVDQGTAPAVPEQGEPDPEESVQRGQLGAFAFSPEGGELNAERGVFQGDGSMTAEEEPGETKEEQDEGWHESRFLGYVDLKVKLLD